jgi:hypothetical protein
MLSRRIALVAAVAAATVGSIVVPAAASTPTTTTAVSIGTHPTGAAVDGAQQGFSVESADFAHGFLTADLLARRLKTLGHNGVLRLGGYSMDLAWPAFGRYATAPVPPEAIGGVVDQSDVDKLRTLVRASGWKVTLGVPLKALIDPALLKDPAKDPAPKVTMDQVLLEVAAVARALGPDLLSVEIGNEYDNVTTMTPAQYYAFMKNYATAIRRVAPRVAVSGPSANTAKVNTQLEGFVAAAKADGPARRMLAEVSSHYYPASHCGTSTTTIAQLLSPETYATTHDKLQGIVALDAQLRLPSVMNETNSASCSGQPGVSDSYATALWSMDYLMQSAQAGIARVQFHTNTAAVCGDFKPRNSPDYPISYRYYGAFCAPDQSALDGDELAATPLYYGLWAFRQVPHGAFLPIEGDLGSLRAYAVRGDHGRVSVVLVNLADPAAGGTSESITLRLPGHVRGGQALTMRSSAPDGLASTDPAAITLGGRTVDAHGIPSGPPRSTPVAVDGTTATITVDAGTAQIVTFATH